MLIPMPMEIVEIYTTQVCPYCTRAKDLLRQNDIPFTEIDVSDPQKRTMLVEKAQGRKTVPQIFIHGKPIGGYDDLKAVYDKGELKTLLEGSVEKSE